MSGDLVGQQPPSRFVSLLATGLVVALAFILGLITYYVPLVVAGVMSTTASLVSTESYPAGFSLVTGAVLYGGFLWAAAIAIFASRSRRQGRADLAYSRFADAVIVVGGGLMGAALGAWPALLAPENRMMHAFMVCAGVGFAVGAAIALIYIAQARRSGNWAT